MASVFKKSPTEPFRMPDLTDVDSEFAKIDKQHVDLNNRKSATDRELATLREELSGARGPVLPAGVAALLGEGVDPILAKRQRAAELGKLSGDLGAAIEIVEKRLRERRDIAKRSLIAAVREEYKRRAVLVAAALDGLHEPLRALDELRRDFDAHGVAGSFEWPNNNLAHFASLFAGAVRKEAA